MVFNHYAKIKRILSDQAPGWYIQRINQPTRAQKFNGEWVAYDHYYRIYTAAGQPIAYCKFQQLDRLAHTLALPIESLPVVTSD